MLSEPNQNSYKGALMVTPQITHNANALGKTNVVQDNQSSPFELNINFVSTSTYSSSYEYEFFNQIRW